MINQLLYLSFATIPVSNEIIESILKRANDNNPKMDITGILLCNSNLFIQLLEGKKENIHLLLDLIKKDERDDEVTVVYEGETENRYFGDWSMAFKDINDCNPEFIKKITPYFSKTKLVNSPAEMIKLLGEFSKSFKVDKAG